MAESKAIRAAIEFEEKLIRAINTAEAIHDAAGDRGPHWVYLHRDTLHELQQALLPLSKAIREGTK